MAASIEPCIYCINHESCIRNALSMSDMIDKRLLNCMILGQDCYIESRNTVKELYDELKRGNKNG